MPVDLGVILTTTWMAVAGAVGIFIPLLIHLLFRRRRQPIEWAAMQFLMDAWSSNRKRIRFEQLSLLFVRCGIPLLLGLALSQPILEDSNLFPGSHSSIHIIIDDGIVSNTVDPDGRREFDDFIEQAHLLLDSLVQGDQASITLAGDSTASIPSSTDIDGLGTWLDGLSPSEHPTRIVQAIRHVHQNLDPTEDPGSQEVVILSSFRGGGIETNMNHGITFPRGVSLRYSRPNQETRENTRVMSIEPLRNFLISGNSPTSQTMEQTIMVKLVRDGEILPATTSRLNISTGGKTRERVVSWDEGESSRVIGVELPTTPSSNVLVQLATNDDQILDNSRYLTLDTRESINILLLDRPFHTGTPATVVTPGSGRWIQYALQPVPESPYRINVLDPAVFQEEDLLGIDVVILTRPDLLDDPGGTWLQDHLERDGLVLVIPPEEQSTTSRWMELVTGAADVSWTATNEPRIHSPSTGLTTLNDSTDSSSPLRIIAGELPSLLESVHVHQSLGLRDVEPGQVILSMDDGTPAIVSSGGEGKRGEMLLLSFPPAPTWTDLPTRPLMVPLFQELVQGGLSLVRGDDDYIVGEKVDMGHIEHATHITRDEATRIPVIESTGLSSTGVPNQGFWSILDNRGMILGSMAMNIQPGSTDTTPADPETIARWLGEEWLPLSRRTTSTAGTPIDTLVFPLLLCLAFLVLSETIMSRMFTRISPRGGG